MSNRCDTVTSLNTYCIQWFISHYVDHQFTFSCAGKQGAFPSNFVEISASDDVATPAKVSIVSEDTEEVAGKKVQCVGFDNIVGSSDIVGSSGMPVPIL